MNIHLYLFITILLVFYGIGNYYIGLQAWRIFHFSNYPIRGKCYKLLFTLLALAYPCARLGEKLFPSNFIDSLTFIGSIWLGTLYYLCLFTALIDIIRFINKRKPFLPSKLMLYPRFIAVVVLCTTLGLISYGTWNARHPVTRSYEITIAKTTGSPNTLHVVMVSDIHLGNIITNQRLTKLINRINQLEPDIILLAGDIVDGNVEVLPKQNMIANFTRLHSTFGTYAILGNHEYFDQKPDQVIDYLEQGNVHVLRDQWTLIANAFYLVGRDDLSKQRYAGINRQDLGTVMTGIDHKLPILLLDHQPHVLQDAVDQGVDLQLSGHTHLGQLFPSSLFTRNIYEIDWGYLRKEGLQVIVSCGVGTWGPPIRIGNHPEIIDLTIHFKKADDTE